MTISNARDTHGTTSRQALDRHEHSVIWSSPITPLLPKFIDKYPRAPKLPKDNLEYDLMQLHIAPKGPGELKMVNPRGSNPMSQ